MKRSFFVIAFLMGIGSVFAFKTKTVSDGYFKRSADCVLGQTNQNGCSTSNMGAQCTINATGNPPAFESTCLQELRVP